MSLKKYNQKRDFKKTPEPKGKVLPVKKGKKLYIIQKHAASHLHYDFRLELNGVLLSWAVPKGPSLDPSIKRLAVHVEGHPLEYGSFEGIIPKGQYGGGTVMLWDKGEWICNDSNAAAAYHKGDLNFTLQAKKLNGKWKLIRINNNDKTWILLKIKDEYAKSSKKFDITVELPNSVITQQSIDEIATHYKNVWGKTSAIKKPVKLKEQNRTTFKIKLTKKPFPKVIHPQLATLVDNPPAGENWLHEIKFDGYRLIAFKKANHTQLFTRNNNDWTKKFMVIATEINKLPIGNIIVDGEVVVLDKNQHSNFQLLQNSIQSGSENFIYYVFDIMYYDNYNLTVLPLIERKKFLQKLISENLDSNEFIRYSDHIVGSGNDVLNKSCELGLEGIISKDSTSLYSQKRDRAWLKTKCIKKQEFIIAGFNKSKHRKYFASLLLATFNKQGDLNYHGNVGTGFTKKSLKTIYELMSKYITSTMPFVKTPPRSKNAVWLKPVLIAEIEFTEWTDSHSLRHPSFKGIRTDKKAKNVTREIPIPVENITNTSPDINNSKTPYKLTHPNKILYSEGNITKLDVTKYYDEIKQWILPYIINRPLTLVRCPENYHHCFYQKHISNNVPSGLYGIMIKEKKGKEKYIYIKDADGLLALPQLGVLEIHPWSSQIENIEHPNILVFDLDPAPEVSWQRVVNAAFAIKEIFSQFKLKSFVKTTGGKGLHVVIPIEPEYEWQQIKDFSHAVVNYLVINNNNEYIDKMAKAARKNKIFLDYLRNQRGATSVAAYSTRARRLAPISTPIAWEELTRDIRDTVFTLHTLPKRLEQLRKDPWKDFFKLRQSLSSRLFRHFSS